MSREITEYGYNRRQVNQRSETTSTRKSSVPVKIASDNSIIIKDTPHGRRPSRKPRIVTVKQKKKTPFPVSIVFSCLIITSLLLVVMFYFAEINKFNSDLTDLKKQVTELREEKDNLQQKLDNRDDVDMIRARAQELGMVDSDMKEKNYVNLTNTDKTEIIERDNQNTGFGFMLSSIGEIFNNLFSN